MQITKTIQKPLKSSDDPTDSRILQFLSPYLERGQSLLDYGCGTGITTLELADLLFPGYVTGIDVSDTKRAEQLAVGREMVNAHFHTIANIYRLPFEDQKFDIIYLHNFLEISEHPWTILMELHRILRPRGILAISYMQQEKAPFLSKSEFEAGAYRNPTAFINLWIKAMDLEVLETPVWKEPSRAPLNQTIRTPLEFQYILRIRGKR